MKKLTTWAWWKAALARAGRQAAQALVVALVVGETVALVGFDWTSAVGFALGGAVMSLISSLVQLPEYAGDTVGRWPAILWRTLRTGLNSLGGLIAAAMAGDLFNAFTFDWPAALLAVAGTMVAAFLMAVAGEPVETRVVWRE